MSDLIDRQAVIKIIDKHIFYNDYDSMDKIGLINAIENLPPVEKRGWWIPVMKEQILQAGYEGREVRFHIGGRLFAIRELAQ